MPRRPDGAVACPAHGDGCQHVYSVAEIAAHGELPLEAYVRGQVNVRIVAELLLQPARRPHLDPIREIAQQLQDNMTLRCPRCQLAFVDYDGCNALTCPRCQAPERQQGWDQ